MQLRRVCFAWRRIIPGLSIMVCNQLHASFVLVLTSKVSVKPSVITFYRGARKHVVRLRLNKVGAFMLGVHVPLAGVEFLIQTHKSYTARCSAVQLSGVNCSYKYGN